jgi:hypothetical protein
MAAMKIIAPLSMAKQGPMDTTIFRSKQTGPSPLTHPLSQLAYAGNQYMLHREKKYEDRGRKVAFVKNIERQWRAIKFNLQLEKPRQ